MNIHNEYTHTHHYYTRCFVTYLNHQYKKNFLYIDCLNIYVITYITLQPIDSNVHVLVMTLS